MKTRCLVAALMAALLVPVTRATAQVPFFFTTGGANNLIGTASRPGPATGANQETESADDFLLTAPLTSITQATFTGLLPAGLTPADVSQVTVEIYRVFPKDSNTARTPNVPTRTNSPSDLAFDTRDSAASTLTFSTLVLSSSFTASNSVDLGINPSPNQHTGGDGSITGQEVQFTTTFAAPFDLPADHYFFVPQVLLSSPSDHFFWLSAARPNVIDPFAPDLQSWIRNAGLDPDWLRVGTDVVGGTTFNASFSIAGTQTPEPGSLALLAGGAVSAPLLLLRRRRR